LVAGAAAGGSFVILEGGVATPSQARAGIAAGAGAVVVGTALSNLDALVRSFATGVAGERRSPV
jgi:putative N-acetylmannosamine-6-phosphate epimerase